MNYGGGGGQPPGYPPGGGPPPGYGPPQPQAGYGAPPQAQPGYGAPPQAQAGYGAPPQAQPGYGAPPQAQPGYGAPPQAQQPGYGPPPGPNPYGAPPGANPYGAPPGAYAPQPQYGAVGRQQHPKVMMVLILGGLAWFGFSLFTAIPAWIMGRGVLKEIQANPQQYSGESEAKIGMWLGIANTILFGGLILLGIVGAIVAVALHS